MRIDRERPTTSAVEGRRRPLRPVDGHARGGDTVAKYEIQGRRTERDADGRPREVVRLDTARSTATAFAIAIAETMVAENLIVWVFERSERIGDGRDYRLLKVLGT